MLLTGLFSYKLETIVQKVYTEAILMNHQSASNNGNHELLIDKQYPYGSSENSNVSLDCLTNRWHRINKYKPNTWTELFQ